MPPMVDKHRSLIKKHIEISNKYNGSLYLGWGDIGIEAPLYLVYSHEKIVLT